VKSFAIRVVEEASHKDNGYLASAMTNGNQLRSVFLNAYSAYLTALKTSANIAEIGKLASSKAL